MCLVAQAAGKRRTPSCPTYHVEQLVCDSSYNVTASFDLVCMTRQIVQGEPIRVSFPLAIDRENLRHLVLTETAATPHDEPESIQAVCGCQLPANCLMSDTTATNKEVLGEGMYSGLAKEIRCKPCYAAYQDMKLIEPNDLK